MKLNNLGRSGLRVSAVGLGCNNFGGRTDAESSRKVVFKALDLGVTLLDTADTYGNRGGSETVMGQLLGDRRKDIVLATKFGMLMDDTGTKQGGARRYIMAALEASLTRLRTDWIDLYQIHRFDPLTPIEETLRALDDLIRHGKVRYIGCSNFAAWQVVDALWTSRHSGLNAFVSCQDEYSLLVRDFERDLMPAMQQHGLGLLPYFPLASGLLTGKYQRNTAPAAGTRMATTKAMADRYLTDRNWTVAEKLIAFARQRGHSPVKLAFSWLLAQPTVASVIAGATRPEQVEENVAAAGWVLTTDELAEIDKITGKVL